jgi:hypothetical protein
MTIINPSGISGRGTLPVSATRPKMTVKITERIAGGMFRSWAWAMDLMLAVLELTDYISWV